MEMGVLLNLFKTLMVVNADKAFASKNFQSMMCKVCSYSFVFCLQVPCACSCHTAGYVLLLAELLYSSTSCTAFWSECEEKLHSMGWCCCEPALLDNYWTPYWRTASWSEQEERSLNGIQMLWAALLKLYAIYLFCVLSSVNGLFTCTDQNHLIPFWHCVPRNFLVWLLWQVSLSMNQQTWNRLSIYYHKSALLQHVII